MSTPRTISEYPALNELAPGSVVRDAEGWVWENIAGTWKHIPYGLAAFLNAVVIPATVLHELSAK